MNVVRFPNRSNALQTAADDAADQAVETDPDSDDEGAAYRHHGGSDYPDHDADRPGQAAERFARKSGPKKRRLSPADILARSMLPVCRVPGARNMPAATPAEIIAQSLCPTGLGSTQELLRQSFWQVWLQHRDYLKKKVFIFWPAIARMPRTP